MFDEEPFRSMLSDEIHYNEDDQPISSNQDSNEKDVEGELPIPNESIGKLRASSSGEILK